MGDLLDQEETIRKVESNQKLERRVSNLKATTVLEFLGGQMNIVSTFERMVSWRDCSGCAAVAAVIACIEVDVG